MTMCLWAVCQRVYNFLIFIELNLCYDEYMKNFNKTFTIKKIFENCSSREDRYNKIIELGKNGAQLNDHEKTESNLVLGCQSKMYLKSWLDGGRIYFQAGSDALISAGLAQLLIIAYEGEHPEVILKEAPEFLEELDIPGSLTPSRANVLYQIHLKMKQDAIRLLAGLHSSSQQVQSADIVDG